MLKKAYYVFIKRAYEYFSYAQSSLETLEGDLAEFIYMGPTFNNVDQFNQLMNDAKALLNDCLTLHNELEEKINLSKESFAELANVVNDYSYVEEALYTRLSLFEDEVRKVPMVLNFINYDSFRTFFWMA